jgi:hypothetical protein
MEIHTILIIFTLQQLPRPVNGCQQIGYLKLQRNVHPIDRENKEGVGEMDQWHSLLWNGEYTALTN